MQAWSNATSNLQRSQKSTLFKTQSVAIPNSMVGNLYGSVEGEGKIVIWDKVFKNGPSKICGRQPFKKLKGYGLLKQTISLQTF